MVQIKKNRISFVKAKDDGDNSNNTNNNVVDNIEVIKPPPKKILPVIIASAIAIVTIATVLVITEYIYKKPQNFTPSPKKTSLIENIKKDIPLSRTENIHLKRGKDSFYKGYFNNAIAEFTEVVESDAKDEDKAIALTYIGIINDKRDNYNKAIEYYNRALKYNNKNPIIYRNLSLAYKNKMNLTKAGEILKKGLDIEPNNINNRILMGNILFHQGKYNEAISQYEKAIKINSENPSALYNLALSLLKTGDELSGIKYLKKAGSIDNFNKIAHLSYSQLGLIYTKMNDHDSAEKYLKLAISINPNDPIDRYNLGIIYLKQNKRTKALAEFVQAEKLCEYDTILLENIGEAYFSLKEYNKSIDAYKRLLQTNKRDVKILSRVAEVYYKDGDMQRALDAYKKITTIKPASENARYAYLNMGNILDDIKRFDEAIETYKKALIINPKDDSTLYNLGIAYKHAKMDELAIESWKKASEINPDTAKSPMAIAKFYYEKNLIDLAMDEYQRILRRWPDIQDAHFNLATIYYKKNLTDYSKEEYKRVIEINNKNELTRKAYINLGIIASNNVKNNEESMNKALNYIQKALLLKPGDAEALFSLGLIYSKKGMHDKSIDTFYQAIKATSEKKLIAESYNNIGKSYYNKRLFKKALQAFTRGIEEEPTIEELRINRKVAMQAYEEELKIR